MAVGRSRTFLNSVGFNVPAPKLATIISWTCFRVATIPIRLRMGSKSVHGRHPRALCGAPTCALLSASTRPVADASMIPNTSSMANAAAAAFVIALIVLSIDSVGILWGEFQLAVRHCRSCSRWAFSSASSASCLTFCLSFTWSCWACA